MDCRPLVAGSGALETSLGWMPHEADLEWCGLNDAARAAYLSLMSIDATAWAHEVMSHEELFGKLGNKLPWPLAIRRQQLLDDLSVSQTQQAGSR